MYSLISNFYSEIFPLTADKLSFAKKQTFIGKSYNILDIGCSTGDLCMAMSKQGHNIVGIDLDSGMIDVANRNKTLYSNLKVEYHQMDMLEIENYFSPQQFHQIYCFGNTIVHLTELNKIYNLFRQIAGLLKPTGCFKGQILNYSYIMENKIFTLPLLESERVSFERYYHHDGNLLQFHTILKDKENKLKQKDSILLYPLNHDLLDELLHNAGFSEIKYYGNFNLEPLEETSMRLVFEAFK